MANAKGGEDVLFLLDSLAGSAPETTATPVHDPAPTENENELLGFLDDLAKQPSRHLAPRPASTAATSHSSRDPVSSTHALTKSQMEKPVSTPAPVLGVKVEGPPEDGGRGGGWLRGFWNIGSFAMKTAEQKVKELQQTEEGKARDERN